MEDFKLKHFVWREDWQSNLCYTVHTRATNWNDNETKRDWINTTTTAKNVVPVFGSSVYLLLRKTSTIKRTKGGNSYHF